MGITKEEAIARLNEHGYFYGYMYGSDHGEICKVASNIHIADEGFIEIWGWPGPDYNYYKWADYCKTWAFTEEEVADMKKNELSRQCYDCMHLKCKEIDTGGNHDYTCQAKPGGLKHAKEELCDLWEPIYEGMTQML